MLAWTIDFPIPALCKFGAETVDADFSANRGVVSANMKAGQLCPEKMHGMFGAIVGMDSFVVNLGMAALVLFWHHNTVFTSGDAKFVSYGGGIETKYCE